MQYNWDALFNQWKFCDSFIANATPDSSGIGIFKDDYFIRVGAYPSIHVESAPADLKFLKDAPFEIRKSLYEWAVTQEQTDYASWKLNHFNKKLKALGVIE